MSASMFAFEETADVASWAFVVAMPAWVVAVDAASAAISAFVIGQSRGVRALAGKRKEQEEN